MTHPPHDEARAVRGPLSDVELSWLKTMGSVAARMAEKLNTALRAALHERDEARKSAASGFIQGASANEASRSTHQAMGIALKNDEVMQLRTRLAEVEAQAGEMRKKLETAAYLAMEMEMEDGSPIPVDSLASLHIKKALTSTTAGSAALACVEALKTLRKDRTLWRVPKGPGGQDQYAGLPPGLRIIDEALAAWDRLHG